MAESTPPKKAPPSGSSSQFRWCPKREQYVALAVCRRQAGQKALCRRCHASWQQRRLPF